MVNYLALNIMNYRLSNYSECDTLLLHTFLIEFVLTGPGIRVDSASPPLTPPRTSSLVTSFSTTLGSVSLSSSVSSSFSSMSSRTPEFDFVIVEHTHPLDLVFYLCQCKPCKSELDSICPFGRSGRIVRVRCRDKIISVCEMRNTGCLKKKDYSKGRVQKKK